MSLSPVVIITAAHLSDRGGPPRDHQPSPVQQRRLHLVSTGRCYGSAILRPASKPVCRGAGALNRRHSAPPNFTGTISASRNRISRVHALQKPTRGLFVSLRFSPIAVFHDENTSDGVNACPTKEFPKPEKEFPRTT